MQNSLLISILFELLQRRRTTATDLAEKYRVSTRTVYRYVDALAQVLPIRIRRGRVGGIYLSDNYRLPVDFFTETEYESLVSALHLAYSACPSESLLSARQKLTAAMKNPSIHAAVTDASALLVLSTKQDRLSDTLQALLSPLKEKKNIRLFYLEGKEQKEHIVEPHALAYMDGKWYLCGFCHTRRTFFPFALSDIYGVFRTNERFRPRKFNPEDVLMGIPCTH